MKSKPFKFLVRLLIGLLVFVFIILPLIWSIRDGEIIGLALPMGAIALWLLGAGKINLLGVRMEGRQAFAVGGALLTPVFIAGIVNNTRIPGLVATVSVLIGLIAAVVLYFRIEPTRLAGNRSTALILSGVGIVLLLIGAAMGGSSDQAGTIFVEGVPVVPFSSAAFFLQLIGLIIFLGGLFGLIFGFKTRN